MNYAQCIDQLLTKKGVMQRKHASTVATILGLQYNSAKQKLDGKRGITLEEIRAIYSYFSEPFDGQRLYNGVFIMNHLHKRCNVVVSDHPAKNMHDGENYAIKREGLFIITPGEQFTADSVIWQVESIEFLAEPCIALLDNDNSILELLKKVCKRYGIQVDTFNTSQEILTASGQKNYDAFILDWLLDFDETAESVVREIRDVKKSAIPVIILTGQLNKFEKNLSEMILNYNINLIEKPAKPLIISSLLLSCLFFNNGNRDI